MRNWPLLRIVFGSVGCLSSAIVLAACAGGERPSHALSPEAAQARQDQGSSEVAPTTDGQGTKQGGPASPGSAGPATGSGMDNPSGPTPRRRLPLGELTDEGTVVPAATAPARSGAARSSVGLPGAEEGRGAGSSGASGLHVYTNEDLRRYRQPGDDATDESALKKAKADQAAFEAEAQKRQQQQPAAEAYKAKLKADAEARVRMAEEKLQNLKWLAMADKNPLVPPPATTEEQDKERAGLSMQERVKATEQQIAEAQAELDAARINLQDVLKQIAAAH